MTDDEYRRFLSALATKHLRALRADFPPRRFQYEHDLADRLDAVTSLTRLVNAAASDRRQDGELIGLVKRRLHEESPIERAGDLMEAVGMLDALEEAPSVVFGEFRRSVVPQEDIEMLRRAGFTDDEIEILLTMAVVFARRLAAEPSYVAQARYRETSSGPTKLSSLIILGEAIRALHEATEELSTPIDEAPKRRRKLFNGIGKLLGGAVMGIGNALVATGTVMAPNPATGSIAIASGAGAIASIMAGIGDLRGE